MALGATSLAEVLGRRLRISRAEARRRIAEAADLGPRRAMTGEALPPRVAESRRPVRRAGRSDAEHVGIIQRFFARLPGWVDPPTREQAEATLAPDRRRGWVPRSCGRPPTGWLVLLRPGRRRCPMTPTANASAVCHPVPSSAPTG